MLDTVYVLLRRQTEDYSHVPECVEIVFLFEESEVRSPNMHLAWARMLSKIQQGKQAYSSRIVINGPAWLNAIAGYFWYGMQGSNTTRQLIYDSKRGVYVEHNYPFDEVFREE